MSTTTTEEVVVVPNEWLDYFYQQHIIDDDLDIPFGAASDAVSDDTSFGGDDVVFSGSGSNMQVSGTDETHTLSVHNVTGTSLNTIASATITTAVASSPENSSNIVDMSPKATITKQVKRRSRASRRTPTTLLNASIKNFRTLVQQYTGCQSANPGFNSRGKGPITLSFGGPHNQHNDFPASFGASFGGSYYYNKQPQFQVNQQHVDQIYGGEQRLHSYGEY